MGMDIDKTWRNKFTAGVDLLIGFCHRVADGGDFSIADRHVSFVRRTARPIDNDATTDDERFSHAFLLLPFRQQVSANACHGSISREVVATVRTSRTSLNAGRMTNGKV